MENYLYFAEAVVETGDDGTSEALCVPASSFIGADPLAAATEFKFKDATGEGAHRVKLTHTAGKNKEVTRAFMACVNANPQKGQFIRVFDGETGTATTKSSFINPVFKGLGVTEATIKEASGTTGTITGVSGGTTRAASYGTGAISTGTVAPGAPQYARTTVGDIIVTTIKVDLTGLGGISDDGDVIGIASGTPAAYVYKNVEVDNGVIFKVEMTCIEVPTSSSNNLADIDLFSASSATLGYNGDVSGGTQLIDAGGDWTKGEIQNDSAIPTANHYLYLAEGATHTGANTFTAGQYLITLYGTRPATA